MPLKNIKKETRVKLGKKSSSAPGTSLSGMPVDLQFVIMSFLSGKDQAQAAAASTELYLLMQMQPEFLQAWANNAANNGRAILKKWREDVEGKQLSFVAGEGMGQSYKRTSRIISIIRALDDDRFSLTRLEVAAGHDPDPALLQKAIDQKTPILIKKAQAEGGHQYFVYGFSEGQWKETELDLQKFWGFNFQESGVTDEIYKEIADKKAHTPVEFPGLFLLGCGKIRRLQLEAVFERLTSEAANKEYQRSVRLGRGGYGFATDEGMYFANSLTAACVMPQGLRYLLSPEGMSALFNDNLSADILALHFNGDGSGFNLQNLMTPRFREALREGLIVPPEHGWPSKEGFAGYLNFILSDAVYPLLQEKLLSFRDFLNIADRCDSDSQWEKWGQAERFVSALLVPNGLIALREKLFSCNTTNLNPEIVNQSKETEWSSYSMDNRRYDKLTNKVLKTLLSDAGIEILRKGYIDLNNLNNPQKKHSMSYYRSDQEQKRDIGHYNRLSLVMTPEGLDAFNRSLFSWADINELDYQQLRLVLSEKGRAALAEKVIAPSQLGSFTDQSLELILSDEGRAALAEKLIPLDSFRWNSDLVNIFLNNPLGMKALRENKIKFSHLSGDVHLYRLLLTEPGLKAISDNIIDTSKLDGCSYALLYFILSEDGAALLKQGRWTVNDLIQLNAHNDPDDALDRIKQLTSPIGTRLIDSGLITVKAVRTWSSEKLAALLTEEGEAVLKKGEQQVWDHYHHHQPQQRYSHHSYGNYYAPPQSVINPKLQEMAQWAPNYLRLMVSKAGQFALEHQLIKVDDSKKYSYDLIQALLTPSGLLAMQVFPDWRTKRPLSDFMQDSSISIVKVIDAIEEKSQPLLRHGGDLGRIEVSRDALLDQDRALTESTREKLIAMIGHSPSTHELTHVLDRVDILAALQQNYYQLPQPENNGEVKSSQADRENKAQELHFSETKLIEGKLNILNQVFFEITKKVVDKDDRSFSLANNKKTLKEYKKVYLDYIKAFLSTKPDADDLERFKLKFIENSGLRALKNVEPKKSIFSGSGTHDKAVKLIDEYEKKQKKQAPSRMP